MHALLISHLRSQIPMVGKDRKKAELIKHLDEVRIDNIANGTTDPWVDSWHHNWRECMMWQNPIPGLPQASGRAQYSSSRLPWRRCHAWKAKKVQMCFLSTLEVFFYEFLPGLTSASLRVTTKHWLPKWSKWYPRFPNHLDKYLK